MAVHHLDQNQIGLIIAKLEYLHLLFLLDAIISDFEKQKKRAEPIVM